MERYSSTIHLDLDDEHFKYVEIHPVVLFTILDQYIRRDDSYIRQRKVITEKIKELESKIKDPKNEDEEARIRMRDKIKTFEADKANLREKDRIIGTLLGYFATDGIVHVTNCYIVPHNEKSDQFHVALNIDFHKKMLNLHSTVSPHQQIVGWFSTRWNPASVLVHNFYAKEINQQPVHLLLDPASLKKGLLSINCYYTMTVNFIDKNKPTQQSRKNPDDKKLQEHFRPIRTVIKSGSHGEKNVLERLIDTKGVPMPSQLSNNLEAVTTALNSLLETINIVSSYVKEVAKGGKPGDIKIARLIEDTIALLPIFEADRFENIFNKGLQDVLMIVYLANLTRTHLLIENIRVNG